MAFSHFRKQIAISLTAALGFASCPQGAEAVPFLDKAMGLWQSKVGKSRDKDGADRADGLDEDGESKVKNLIT